MDGVSFWIIKFSSTFMRLMNEVLKDYISKFVIVYLDDILIYNIYKDDHTRHLDYVL